MTIYPMTMQVLSVDLVRRIGGGTDFNWDQAGPSYPCDLQPVEASKQVALLELGIRASGKLYWDPADIVIEDDARIKVGADVYKLSTSASAVNQRPGWPSKAFVMEARL